MLAMLGFGASFWGAKAGSRPSSAASSSSRASAGSTASGGSTAPSESEQKILVSSEKSTKDKCFSSSQKLVEKGVFSFSGDIFVATDVSGNSFTKKSFLQFILEDVIKKNMNDPITCEMIASKDAGLELGGVGASHITDNGRPVSGIGAGGNIEYGQPRSNPVPPPAQNTASNPGFSSGIGSMHSSLGNQSPRPATPNISEPIVQTNGVNANHSSPAPQTQGLGSQSLSGSKPLSHFSSSPSSVNPISPQPVQRQQPMQSSAIQPPHLSSSAPLHTSHLQTAQLQPAHSLGAPAGLGHLHR